MSPPEEDRPPGWLAKFADRALDLAPIRWVRPILVDYDAAGGGLLAAGLAYSSLFAILPAIVLVVSLFGLVIHDPVKLDDLIRALADKFPPLETFFRDALGQVRAGAIPFSIIGLGGLIWGSSRFYQSLDDAIARVFQETHRRGLIRRSLLGILAVGVIVAAVVGAVYLSTLLEEAGNGRAAELLSRAVTSTLRSGVGTVAIFSLTVAVIYRLVPTSSPAWRAIARPAVAAGIALAAMTAAFALAAPRLVGSLQLYGAFVAIFGAMIWLSFASQVILLGAVWVHRNASGPAGAGRPPDPDGDVDRKVGSAIGIDRP